MNKLYSFQYSDYGSSYHVVAENKESALDYLKEYLREKTIGVEKHDRNAQSGNYFITFAFREYEMWKNATVDNLPDDYSIVTHEVGDILETERS